MPVDAWRAVIDDPTFADAILDRLVHTAYRFDLDGPSMRKLKAGGGSRRPDHDRRAQPDARPRASTGPSRARRRVSPRSARRAARGTLPLMTGTACAALDQKKDD